MLFKTRLTRLVTGLKNTGKRFIESPRGEVMMTLNTLLTFNKVYYLTQTS